jgi:oligoendopeptidase F
LVARYCAVLATGGTEHDAEFLASFGLDARDATFWQVGLAMIEGWSLRIEDKR